MALVVLLPTYQRPGPLRWSMESILQQNLRSVSVEKRIVVLNNDSKSRAQVDKSIASAVENVPNHSFNQIIVVHRDPPLFAVQNFYDGLKEFTSDGDVAIIHGDDDMLLQNSLAERYRVCNASPFSVIIAKVSGGCFFLTERPEIFIDDLASVSPINDPVDWRPAVELDLTAYSLPFVSAYSIKVGPSFWTTYKQALRWATELPLEDKIRLPFLPFFIGVSAWKNQQLAVISQTLVKRGQYVHPSFFRPPQFVTEYANTGIILLTGMAVLNNGELRPLSALNGLRRDFENATSGHILFSLFRRDGVSLSQLSVLNRLAGVRWWSRRRALRTANASARSILQNLFGLKNLRRRLFGWGKPSTTEDFWRIWNGELA